MINRAFENHLEWLALHRAEITESSDTISFKSEHPEFQYVILKTTSDFAKATLGQSAVRILPWSGDWDKELKAAGYTLKDSGCLNYMTLQADLRASLPVTRAVREEYFREFEIVEVESVAQLKAFNQVCLRSFIEDPTERARNGSFFSRANTKNVGSSFQKFFIGLSQGEPVSCLNTLSYRGTVGIYGVGTLPESRGRGFSSNLLNHAIDDARLSGCDLVTLQVRKDSGAECLYEKLGFKVQGVNLYYSRTFSTS